MTKRRGPSHTEKLAIGSLAIKRPDIAALWDYSKNGDLRPEGVLNRSRTEVYWACPAGPDHEFRKAPSVTSGCPFCAGRMTSVTNSIASQAPDVAREWHPTKNGALTPADVTIGSSAVTWWLCPDGHAFEMMVSERTGKKPRRCTECVRLHGKKVPVKNPLADRRPDIAAYWDIEANGDLTPSDVSVADSRMAHWRCAEGPDHVWTRSVVEMRHPRCPYCTHKWASITNCLATVEPAIAAEWHPSLNGALTPQDVLPGAGMKVWWLCPKGHDWASTPNRRTNPRHRSACSECARIAGRPQRGNARSIAELYPHVVRYWHASNNGDLSPRDIKRTHPASVWWQCPKSPLHEWQAKPESMARDKEPTCPFCFGWKVCADNSLESLNPALAAQWHPSRNGDLRPDGVTLIDRPPVWWKCDVADDHEWRAKVYSRAVMGHGCPACSGKQLSVTNRLDLTYPVLAAEFDSVRNGITPDQVKYGAPARYWWTCRHCSHQWQTRVEKRTKSGHGCPECAVYNVSKEELFLAHEIAAFLPVDPALTRVRDATGKAWRIDIAIPEHRLIVEYDGSYWHADRALADTAKTVALTTEGWTVLRVREQPLPQLDNVWTVDCRPERYIETAAAAISALAEVGLISHDDAAAYVAGGVLIGRDAALAAIEARATKRSARRQALQSTAA